MVYWRYLYKIRADNDGKDHGISRQKWSGSNYFILDMLFEDLDLHERL